MKKLFLLIVLVVLSSCATHTSFNTFYKNNSHHSDFSLGLNSSLIRGFLSGEDFEDIKPLLKSAKHVRVMVFSNNSNQMNTKFNKFIKHSSFDNLVKVSDDGNNVRVFSLDRNDKIREIVVQISTGDELVLLGLKTNLTQDELARLLNDNEITFN